MHKQNEKGVMRKGFTLVELMVVIAVLGILTAIVIVTYNGVRGRGYDASIQSDLEGAQGLLEAYRVRSTPRDFPDTTNELTLAELSFSTNSYDTTVSSNLVYCVSSDRQKYTIFAGSRTKKVFAITQDGFISSTLNSSQITSSLCSGRSQDFISRGISSGNWEAWAAG